MNNAITHIANRYFESHKTGGEEWPDSAEFAAKVCTHTWPMGWDSESTMKFFDSAEQLHNWMDSCAKWAKEEDNDIAYVIYEWDLGPKIRHDLSRDALIVSDTFSEKVARTSYQIK